MQPTKAARSAKRWTLWSLLACSWLGLGAAAAPAAPPGFATEQGLAEARAELARLEARRAGIDRGWLDLEEALDRLDYDADRIIELVRDDVGFDEYPGALRGATGTLQSRSGNLIDQSLLLARLLRDAGYDARIVRGEVDAATYRRALDALRTGDVAPAAELTSSAAQRLAAGLEAGRERLAARAAKLAVKIPQPEPTPAAGPRSVFWVEYRDGAGDGWVPLYPALPDALAAARPVEYFADALPSELQHVVSFELLVEQLVGDRPQAPQTIMTWSRPTALLHGEAASVTLALVPRNVLQPADVTSLDEKIDEARLFVPFIDGSLAPGGRVLTASGQLVPADEALSFMGEVFATAAARVDDAASALASMNRAEGEAEPLRRIGRVWLQVTLTAPGSADRVFERTLGRWSGDGVQLKRDITREITLTVQTGEMSPQQYALSSIDAAADLIGAMSRQPPPATGSVFGSATLKRYEAEKFLAAEAMYAATFGWRDVYRSGPTVLARYRALGHFDTVEAGFDIVTAPRSIRPAGAAGGYLETGLLAATLEASYFADPAAGDSALARLAAHGEGADWRLIDSADDAELARLPRATATRLRQDLREGWQVLLAEVGGTLAHDAWWRVSPDTGELIPALANGWGGVRWIAAAEGATDLTLRGFLTKLARTHGPLKVYSAAGSCSFIYGLAKVDQYLSVPGVLGEGYNQATGENLSPCTVIPDEFWRTACELGYHAAKAASLVMQGTGTDKMPYPAFMQTCVVFVVS